MTANRMQVGVLAVGLLVVLVAVGCSGDDDLISSGNVVVTYPASTINPASIDYSCIRLDYTSLTVKPTDGTCSADSGEEFAGRPCGTDTDCTDVSASCDDSFSNGCDDGPNENQPCTGPLDCPGGSCVPRGECASFPGGIFTGTGCISDLDCTLGSAEKCAGRCSLGSSNPNGACLNAGDCTLGTCEGAQAADTLGGNVVTLINGTTPVFFTPACPACELDQASPVLCDPSDPVECENECRPAAEIPDVPCLTEKCCEKFDLVSPPCDTTADCVVNQCTDSVTLLASNTLPAGKYDITQLGVVNLLLFAPGTARELISCSGGGSVGSQYDPPLHFEVGPGLSNEVRFVIDLTKLEQQLGLPDTVNCSAALNNFPAWFEVVSN